jgi:hypothetical protein
MCRYWAAVRSDGANPNPAVILKIRIILAALVLLVWGQADASIISIGASAKITGGSA